MTGRDVETHHHGSITVAYQILSRICIGEGLYHLLPDPLAGWMFRDPEMQHPSPLVCEHQKHKQYPQSNGRHGKEVGRNNLTNMVLEEGSSGL